MVATAITAGWIGLMVGFAAGLEVLPHLKDWQTLIAAAVALLAAFVAWFNVQKTLRINVISREEDRIETHLAGLRDALTLMGKIDAQLKFAQHDLGKIPAVLNEFGLESSDTSTDVEKLLPRTDHETRIRVVAAVSWVRFRLSLRGGAKTMLELPQSTQPLSERTERFDEADRQLRRAVEEFHEATLGLLERVRRAEEQLPLFRRQIEAFFAEK
jgi:hypothetical protein